jgi:hypothetical protein
MKPLREILAAAALLFAIVTAATSYSTLPKRIATHFNASGIASHWGDKSALWEVVGIACLLYLVLTLIRFAPASTFSVPVPPERRAAAIPIALDMIAWSEPKRCACSRSSPGQSSPQPRAAARVLASGFSP